MNRGVEKKGIRRIWLIGADIFLPHCLVTGICNSWLQKRSLDRNLVEHRSIRRFGIASTGTALLVFCFRMFSW